MNADKRSHVVASVAASVCTAAVLGVAGVVLRAPADAKERDQLHQDIARVETRLERIENLLMQRKK